MSRPHLPTLALVLILGLIVGYLLPAGAQERWDGPRWEYRVFVMNVEDYQEKQDYLQILAQNGDNGRRAEPAFQEHVLNFLGQQGWEFVSFERRYPGQVHLFLKRPKS